MKTIKFEVEVEEEDMRKLDKMFGEIGDPMDSMEECIKELFYLEGHTMMEFDIRDKVKVRIVK